MRWNSKPSIGDSTQEDELFEEGNEVAEEAEEYPEADNEDLAGLK